MSTLLSDGRTYEAVDLDDPDAVLRAVRAHHEGLACFHLPFLGKDERGDLYWGPGIEPWPVEGVA